jgi:glycosyltransferase involved in cell wall biosynthesis
MRVLYLSHTPLVSGGERALLELLRAPPPNVRPVVMCPPGVLAREVRACGVDVVAFRGTDASLRLHPILTPKGIAELVGARRAIRRAIDDVSADLIHANSIRAGIMAVLAVGRGGPPIVVHVHDALPENPLAAGIRRLLLRRADALIAVSRYVARPFTSDHADGRVHVLYNPIDVERFTPHRLTREAARAGLGLPPDAPLIAVVAQITPWKGQDVAVRALAAVRRRHPDARLLLVGEPKFVSRSTRYDNLRFRDELRDLIADCGLQDAVEFLGERDDVPAILRAVDMLLVPSWEEPLGRSMLEAMASGTPVVATDVGGPREVVEDGVSGLLAPPDRPDRWAAAVLRLLDDGALRAGIAAAARTTVEARFTRADVSRRVGEVYEQVLTSRRAR